MLNKNIKIDNIDFILISTPCPEQYDAFIGNKQVGYLRLRHGVFTVDFPDVMGEEIYRAYPQGEGEFLEEEREKFLTIAAQKIQFRLELCKNSKDTK